MTHGVRAESLMRHLARRHQSGLQHLDMDSQASEHYNEPVDGMLHRLWRLRVYCRGFINVG